MPPGQDDAGERILDLALYAPLGLVMSVVEAVPDLVRKGRDRLGPQVGMARTIGQFAVGQGYRQVVGLARSRPTFPFRPGAPPDKTYDVGTAEPAGHEDGSDGYRDGDGEGATTGPTAPADLAGAVVPLSPEAHVLDVGQLAIPSYDSLSATQVVERLTGLSRDEIAAVAAYEAATRQRKTILVRAEQLLT